MRSGSFSKIALLLISSGVLLSMGDTPLWADRLPVEPEEDNQEYLLDLAANRYNRVWREVWDRSDNRLRFRLGSNNVREWYVEEELKLSAPLLDRLRLRFYHSRLLDYTSRRRSFDTIEIEGRIVRDYYVSFFGTPTYNKVDNSLGIIFQRRTAVDRYALVYLELPRFLNNFTEHHKETSDTLLSLYSRQPVKLGVEMRVAFGANLLSRLGGYFTNTYEIVGEHIPDGRRRKRESGRFAALSGWLEYASDVSGDPSEVDAWGLEGGLYRYRKDRPATVVDGYASSYRKDRLSLPRSTIGDLPYIDLDVDPFTEIRGDTITFAEEHQGFLEPYTWKVLGKSLTLHGSIRFQKSTISWENARGQQLEIENEYVVPYAGVRVSIGQKGSSIIEGGMVAEYRRRTFREKAASVLAGTSEDKFRDHRLLLSYEYLFGEDTFLRIIESIDLDREDWGQFSIHDHGFFQLIAGF